MNHPDLEDILPYVLDTDKDDEVQPAEKMPLKAKTWCKKLGEELGSISAMFDPELIILGGDLGRIKDEALEELLNAARFRVYESRRKDLLIKRAHLNDPRKLVLSAAQLYFHNAYAGMGI